MDGDGRSGGRWWRRAAAWLTVAGVCALGACAKEGSRADEARAVDLREGPEVFKGRPRLGGDRPIATDDAAWTIVLAAFRGGEHRAMAEQALPAILGVREVEDAFVTTRGEATFIGVGRYGDPSDPAAQARLKRVRETAVGMERPFADAFLAPPATGSLAGSRPEFNLLRVRESRGKAALVTLQVGVYERIDGRATDADLAEIRSAAEEAAAQLRREGEQAYYFHGPRRSMVTVGVFDEDEVVKRRSPAAAALKKRHPYNLLNGQGYKTSAQGAVRSSEYVRVP